MNESPMNRGRGYTAYTGGASSVGIETLADRPVRQVGRSPDDPKRMASMLRRQGNYKPALQLGMMGLEQAFADEQGDKRFGQTKELRGLDQAFQAEQTKQQQGFYDQQGDKRYGQQKEMYGLGQADQVMRDNKHRSWQLEDQQNQGIDSAFALPLPDGSGYVPMVKDKMGRASAAGGFMPNKPKTAVQSPADIAKHISDNLTKGVIASHDGKAWSYTPLKPGKPVDDGSETTTTDAQGNVVQKQTRRKLKPGEGAGAAPPAGVGPVKKPSGFLSSLLGD